jgi:hypothetical protein
MAAAGVDPSLSPFARIGPECPKAANAGIGLFSNYYNNNIYLELWTPKGCKMQREVARIGAWDA